MLTGFRNRNLLCCMLLAVVLIGSLLTPARAFNTGQSASLVIGHASFDWGGHGPANQTGFYNPTFLTFDASGNLWVADRYYCRVLMFKPPFATGMAASMVIGQTNFASSGCGTSSTRLNSPYGLAFDAFRQPLGRRPYE